MEKKARKLIIISFIIFIMSFVMNSGISDASETNRVIDDANIIKQIYAYKTEWSLYGTIELQNKIDAYNNTMKTIPINEIVGSEGRYKEHGRSSP